MKNTTDRAIHHLMGKGAQTREAILDQAVGLASEFGLAGLSLGRLAAGLAHVVATSVAFEKHADATLREAGDLVVVKGSRVTFAGNPAIIAAEVKKGDAVLKLRDENGFPAWAGWRK